MVMVNNTDRLVQETSLKNWQHPREATEKSREQG
jgi:hypothetical protein